MAFLDDIIDFFLGGEDKEESTSATQASTSQSTEQTSTTGAEETQTSSQAVTTGDSSTSTTQQTSQGTTTGQNLQEGQTTTGNTVAQQTQQQAGTQQTLDAGTLNVLRTLIPQLAGGVPTASQGQGVLNAASAQATGMPKEIDRIVELAKTGAVSEFETQTLPALQQLMNSIGGSEKTNSISGALKTQANTDLAGKLAGIEGQIRLQGLGAGQEALRTAADVGGAQTNALANIVNALAGGEVTSRTSATGEETTDESQVIDLVRMLTGTQDVTGLVTGDTQVKTQESTETTENELVRKLISALTEAEGSSTGSATGESFGSTSGSFTKLLAALGGKQY